MGVRKYVLCIQFRLVLLDGRQRLEATPYAYGAHPDTPFRAASATLDLADIGNTDIETASIDDATITHAEMDSAEVQALTAPGLAPVGSILPFGGDPAMLPSDWVLCDGRTVDDPHVGLRDFNPGEDGVQVPALLDDRFLAGVPTERVGETGGRNDIPSDGQHSHGLTATFPQQYSQDLSFSGYRMNEAGQHTHGAENRPLYLGVLYIIRIE